jgi:hypothetical protein
MSDLVTVDPFTPLYTYEKMKDPSKHLVIRAFKKSLVMGVDRLVELARGRDSISTDSDWMVLERVVEFYANEWPEEWAEFVKTIPDIRATRNEKGLSVSKEIKYVGAIPPRLERLIKVVFPHQVWDKKFLYSLVRRFKIFKVS